MEAAGKSEKSHPVRGGTLDVFVMFYLLGISIHPPRAGWDVKVYKIIPFYCTALYGNDKRNGKRHSEIAENGCVFPKHRYARQKHSANRHGNLCSLPLRTFK